MPAASSSAHVAPSHAPRIVVEGLIHRGELAGLELREARAHATLTGVIAAGAVTLTLFAGFAATFAVAAAVWHREDRGLILGLTALAYLLGSAALCWWAARRLRSWQPFGESRRQFKEDCACLHDLMSARAR